MKKYLLLVLILTFSLFGSSCYFLVQEEKTEIKESTKTEAVSAESDKESGKVSKSEETDKTDKSDKTSIKVYATIKTSIGGQEQEEMVLELYPEIAPNTVNNFIELADSGYYDGIIFHRVISGFMIQGGDPTGTGMGGPEYSIKGEFSNNGFENKLSHKRGTISMARSQDYNSAGSQFFICHADADFLDGDYATFGKLIKGESTLDNIAKVETKSDRPIDECKIESLTIDYNGYVLKEVEKIK